MAEQQEQDRSEQATPFKLREARKRGQVSKSLEVNSLLVLSAGLAALYFLGEKMISQQLAFSRSVFNNIHRFPMEPTHLTQWFEMAFFYVINIFWPLLAALMIIGIAANMFQTGPIFSLFPIKPDIKRLDPIAGFKRVFSKKLLFESLKTFIKLFVFGAVLYFAVMAMLPSLFSLISIDPDFYALFLLDSTRSLMSKMLLVLLLIALLDLMYSKWDFANRMRMSRREVKEEVKRREGDPQVRAKRRELQKEAAKRAASTQNVPDADVLITNPTHLAIALKYDRNKMIAPELIAKGAGDLALAMKHIARKHNVMVVENKPLARALFERVELEQAIPEDLFPRVAKILAWVFIARERKQAGAGV